MIGFCAWVGALLMCIAPFIIDSDAGKGVAIVGLFLLTIRAHATRSHNLILLNIIGIGGYCYAIYF